MQTGKEKQRHEIATAAMAASIHTMPIDAISNPHLRVKIAKSAYLMADEMLAAGVDNPAGTEERQMD